MSALGVPISAVVLCQARARRPWRREAQGRADIRHFLPEIIGFAVSLGLPESRHGIVISRRRHDVGIWRLVGRLRRGDDHLVISWFIGVLSGVDRDEIVRPTKFLPEVCRPARDHRGAAKEHPGPVAVQLRPLASIIPVRFSIDIPIVILEPP